MLKMMLRLGADILVYIITLPLKILCLIVGLIYGIVTAIRFKEPVSEYLSVLYHSMRLTLKNEWHWIKTGKTLEDFEELLEAIV